MNGRGLSMDNVLVERLWRSLKYEHVHLTGCAHGRAGPLRDYCVGLVMPGERKSV
jgi:hypothetical protein